MLNSNFLVVNELHKTNSTTAKNDVEMMSYSQFPSSRDTNCRISMKEDEFTSTSLLEELNNSDPSIISIADKQEIMQLLIICGVIMPSREQANRNNSNNNNEMLYYLQSFWFYFVQFLYFYCFVSGVVLALLEPSQRANQITDSFFTIQLVLVVPVVYFGRRRLFEVRQKIDQLHMHTAMKKVKLFASICFVFQLYYWIFFIGFFPMMGTGSYKDGISTPFQRFELSLSTVSYLPVCLGLSASLLFFLTDANASKAVVINCLKRIPDYKFQNPNCFGFFSDNNNSNSNSNHDDIISDGDGNRNSNSNNRSNHGNNKSNTEIEGVVVSEINSNNNNNSNSNEVLTLKFWLAARAEVTNRVNEQFIGNTILLIVAIINAIALVVGVILYNNPTISRDAFMLIIPTIIVSYGREIVILFFILFAVADVNDLASQFLKKLTEHEVLKTDDGKHILLMSLVSPIKFTVLGQALTSQDIYIRLGGYALSVLIPILRGMIVLKNGSTSDVSL